MKIKHGLLSVLASLLVAALVIPGCAAPAPAPAPAPETFEFVYSNFSAESNEFWSILPQKLWDKIYERSGGRITVRTVHGGALLTETDMAEGVGSGVADIGSLYTGYGSMLHLVNCLGGVLDLKVGAELGEEGVTLIHKKMFEQFPPYREELGKVNCTLAYTVASDGYAIIMREPVTSLADLAGRKVRMPGKYLPKLAEAGGFTPVSMSAHDIYVSLSTGLLDGATSTTEFIRGGKWYEVASHLFFPCPEGMCVPTPLAAVNYVIMNQDSYNKLPADLKKIWDDAAAEQWEIAAKRMAEIREIATQKMVDEGTAVEYLSEKDWKAWIAACPDWLQMVEDDLNEMGDPGTDFVALFKKLSADYAAGKLTW